MSIKVYLHYKEHPEKTSKLSIPGSWQSKTVADVITLFVKPYNEKNSENILDVGKIHLVDEEGKVLFSNSLVSESLIDRGEYTIRLGTRIKEAVVVVKETRPRCKNYGCNKYFTDEDNVEGCCCHHTAPPIFHDTMKCWSCCSDRKAFDFESFQLIEGCTIGRHSTVGPQVAIAPSPNAPASRSGSEAAPVTVLKSIADYNNSNVNAVTAATSAVKTIATRKSTRKDDGTARCLRGGCQKTFNFTENQSEACRYHKGQAVFHDVAKYWSCCPDKKCFDFDDFMAVPGCSIGFHDDGVIDL